MGRRSRLQLAADRGFSRTIEDTEAVKKVIQDTTITRYKNYMQIWRVCNIHYLRETEFGFRKCDAPFITRQIFEAYMLFWINTSHGRLEQKVTLASAKAHWRGLKAAWDRYSPNKRPEGTDIEINNYLDQLKKTGHLCDEGRRQDVFMANDLDNILRFVWTLDDHQYRNERIRIQLSLLMMILAGTTQRPGAVVESIYHSQTGQALRYKDLELRLVQNPETKEREFFLLVQFDYMKNRRDKKQDFVSVALHESESGMCPIALFLSLAIQDDAFDNGLGAEDLLLLRRAPFKEDIVIPWKPSAINLHLFRDCKKGRVLNSPWTAKTASYHLKTLGVRAGFQHTLTFYNIRRGSANAVDEVATSAQRNQLTGHRNSDTYRFYISKISLVDIQAAFAGTKPKTAQIKQLASMSSNRDLEAPSKLPEDIKLSALVNEELIQLKEEKACVLQKIRDEFGSLSNAVDAKSELEQDFQTLNKQIKLITRRLSERAFRNYREDFFREKKIADVKHQLKVAKGDITHSEKPLSFRLPQDNLIEPRTIVAKAVSGIGELFGIDCAGPLSQLLGSDVDTKFPDMPILEANSTPNSLSESRFMNIFCKESYPGGYPPHNNAIFPFSLARCLWDGCEASFGSNEDLEDHLRDHSQCQSVCLWPHCKTILGRGKNRVMHLGIHTKSARSDPETVSANIILSSTGPEDPEMQFIRITEASAVHTLLSDLPNNSMDNHDSEHATDKSFVQYSSTQEYEYFCRPVKRKWDRTSIESKPTLEKLSENSASEGARKRRTSTKNTCGSKQQSRDMEITRRSKRLRQRDECRSGYARKSG
ncbi:hypothetical protein BDD12DRAFT_905659 [Trichophaea hybrida]|nr:hypothetical protein BDD12DRAFT_905659 [Trichophaea hybrida]